MKMRLNASSVITNHPPVRYGLDIRSLFQSCSLLAWSIVIRMIPRFMKASHSLHGDMSITLPCASATFRLNVCGRVLSRTW